MRKRIGGMRGGPRKLVYGINGIAEGCILFTDASISYMPCAIDWHSEVLATMELCEFPW